MFIFDSKHEAPFVHRQWKAGMDLLKTGWESAVFATPLPDDCARFTLPGTTDEQGFGLRDQPANLKNLQRRYEYMGTLWLENEFEVPPEDAGKQFVLRLERVNWQSTLWLDGAYVASCALLNAAHIYVLPASLTPGKHRLTLAIDNSNVEGSYYTREQLESAVLCEGGDPVTLRHSQRFLPECARALCVENRSGETSEREYAHRDLSSEGGRQKLLKCGGHHTIFLMDTNWLGVTGEAALYAMPATRPEWADVECIENGAALALHVRFQQSEPHPCMVRVSCAMNGLPLCDISVSLPKKAENRQTFHISLDRPLPAWGPHTPDAMRELCVTVREEASDAVTCFALPFAYRMLKAQNERLYLNGERLFLRGTLEDCTFPDTFAPVHDALHWRSFFDTIRQYGLNHVRFHSWCPPEIAFSEADRQGMLLQIELPGSSCPSAPEDERTRAFLDESLDAILSSFGHHPSFCFLSMGNEQLVDFSPAFLPRHLALLCARVRHAQQTDSRHLYTTTSHPYMKNRPDDYCTSAWTPEGTDRSRQAQGEYFQYHSPDTGFLDGIRWGGSDPVRTSVYCLRRPGGDRDYDGGLKGLDKPLLSHELGQWAVFPDTREIPLYKGVLRPGNLEIIRDQLRKNGLEEQVGTFVEASGQLSLMLYRDEIETCLKSEKLSGFQLLRLFDYPGQGTSTVGILDAHRNSKHLLSPSEFRAFCDDDVLLARFERYCWSENETLDFTFYLSKYSDRIYRQPRISFCVEAMGIPLAQGSDAAPEGLNGHGLHYLSVGLCAGWKKKLPHAAEGSVSVTLDALDEYGQAITLQNRWPIWLYPDDSPVNLGQKLPGGFTLYESENAAACAQALARGDSVVYLCAAQEKGTVSVPFTTVFWNPQMKKQPGTYGLVCNCEHPVFRQFPTRAYTAWNWWGPLQHARAIDLTGAEIIVSHPDATLPLRAIDSFVTCRSLTPLCCFNVGEHGGKLVVCGVPLPGAGDDVSMRQFWRSLLASLAGGDALFTAADQITLPQAQRLMGIDAE